MGLILYLFLSTWLNLQSSGVFGSCLASQDSREFQYMMKQNQKLHDACMNKKLPNFDPIPIENWESYSEPTYKRAFKLMSSYIEYEAKVNEKISKEELQNLEARMSNIHNNAKVCLYEGEATKTKENGCTEKMLEELYEVFEKTNNAEERKHYWTSWRDETGKRIREVFEKNHEKVVTPIADNQYWIAEYESTREEILKDLNKAWQDLLPLYKQLHAYIRRQLIKEFGDEMVRSNGPIPEHLLDLIARDWWSLKSKSLPSPEERYLVTIMQEKEMTIPQIIEICKDFYRSLGFAPLGDEFWNNLREVHTDEPNCQNSEFHGCNGSGASMTICRVKGGGYDFFYYMIQNLISVYGEKWMSRFRQCGWPDVVNGFPNPGFLSGLRGLVDISTSSREYTKDIGLMTEEEMEPWDTEVINHLLKMALWSFVNLQYYYNIAKWRMDFYSGDIQVQNMNTKWWEYSLKYRGVCPPVKRTESDFDPGALPEVADNSPVVSELLGGIYQYQFHKALCKVEGTHNLLQNCTIYKSTEAGAKIREMLDVGRTKPWQEAMQVMTGGQSAKLDTQALLDYYQPLYLWLQRQNKNEFIGWKSDDATVCP